MEKINAELLIFDLDGTLIDSSHDIAWAANMTMKSMGYDGLDLEAIKESIGWGVKPLLEKLMPKEGPEAIEAARGRFLELYGGHLVVETYLYPGVRETIEYFLAEDKKIAIVTNKPVKLAVRILAELGMDSQFLLVLGGDSLANKKPHPEPVEKTFTSLGVSPSLSVMIGDSPIDCEAGKSAGIKTIGVTYGYRGHEELTCCDAVVDSFPGLKDVIL
ncbi:MAG: HAD-IA family hydrolase [Deltaproteobacteria bacterium]|nr:HAD-IA family hydrolase [Deltaproteobacteria bacterium]